jgi:hypothetical protein
MEKHEERRVELVALIADAKEATRDSEKIHSMTNPQVAKLMRSLREEVLTLDRVKVRDFLTALVQAVVLDADAQTLVITDRLAALTRVRLASPAGFEPAYLP